MIDMTPQPPVVELPRMSRWAIVRRFVMRRSVMRWAGEIAGVAILAVGAWMIFSPAGVIIVALYVILLANQGGGEDASDRTGS